MMFKTKSYHVAILGAAFFAFFAAPALAGGQLVTLVADSNGWISGDSYGRIIRVFLNPEFPCKGTEITFKFVDLKEGDYVSTGSGSATFIMQEDRQPFSKNGITGSTCGTYAKVSSKVYGERKFTVNVKNGDRIWPEQNAPVIKVDFDGKYHPDNSSDDYEYRSSPDDPSFGMTVAPVSDPLPSPSYLPEGKIGIKVLDDKLVGSSMRELLIKFGWPQTEGNISYTIFKRPSDEHSWQRVLSDGKGPSVSIRVEADKDYYIKVLGCVNKAGVCGDSELFIPKLKNISSPEQVSSDTAQLQQKVDNLQKKLEESQARQSALESRLNAIIAWIKNLLPFFK